MADEITRGWASWRRWDGEKWIERNPAAEPPGAPGAPPEALEGGGYLKVSARYLKVSAEREPIQTHHIYPPIPIRIYDWCAYRDPERTPYGYGSTEAEAIADLLSLEEEESE